ncbi:TSYL5 protein, partial [Pitta sordida]|nr:TSYL5 protein [Pitta sordida]
TETPKNGLETPREVLETPGRGMETPGEVLETHKDEIETPIRGLETPKERLEPPITQCLEREEGGLETTGEVLKNPETTRETTRGLKTTITPCLEKDKGVLVEPRGSPETTREVPGTTNGRKGSLETALTRCLEHGRRSQGGSETTGKAPGGLQADGPPATARGPRTTSRRKAGLKTPGRPKGSAETVGRQWMDWERSRNGDLEDTGELETTREEAEDNLEPTPITACVGQSRGGPGVPEPAGVPEPVEIPEPAGVPDPKAQVAEESAVISLGEEDDDEEEDEEQEEGPGRYLAALEAVQLELEAVEEEAARAFRRLHARFGLRRRPHLQRRNRLIQHIPGFWVTAFLNHPQLSAMISDRDEDALSYMTSLQVEEFGQSRPGCRIRFFFSVNPYFQNDVVAKEFVRGPSG